MSVVQVVNLNNILCNACYQPVIQEYSTCQKGHFCSQRCFSRYWGEVENCDLKTLEVSEIKRVPSDGGEVFFVGVQIFAWGKKTVTDLIFGDPNSQVILKDCHFTAQRAIIIIGKSVKITSCTMNAKYLTIIGYESLTINGQNIGSEPMIIERNGYRERATSMYAERIELARKSDWEMQIPKQLLSERTLSSSLIIPDKVPLGALDMDRNILGMIFEYLDEESLRALSVVNHQMMELTVSFIREKRKKGFQALYQEFQGLHHDREFCYIAEDLMQSKNLKAINKVCIENLKGACGIVIEDLLSHRAFLQLYFPKECFEEKNYQLYLQNAIYQVEKKEQVALQRKDAKRLPCVFWSIPVQLGLVFLAIENGWLLAMPMLLMVIGECLLIIRGTYFNNH